MKNFLLSRLVMRVAATMTGLGTVASSTMAAATGDLVVIACNPNGNDDIALAALANRPQSAR